MRRIGKRLRSDNVFPERDFPLRIMRNNPGTTDTSPDVPLHSHEFHELVVVTRGTGQHLTSTGDYQLESGDVFLIRGRSGHAYGPTRHLAYINILFEPDRLGMPSADLAHLPGYHLLFRIEPKLRSAHGLRACLKLTADQLAEALRLVTLIEEEIGAHRDGYRFMATAQLMRLIGYLSRTHSSNEPPERRALYKIGQALSFIEQHLSERITIDRLCDVAGMSESSLARVFHEVVGKPPMEHCISARVTRAATLLRTTDEQVTRIAHECGFTDSNYFSRQFKRIMGSSPRTYRHET